MISRNGAKEISRLSRVPRCVLTGVACTTAPPAVSSAYRLSAAKVGRWVWKVV